MVTAMELEPDGGVHILDAPTWQNRQDSLTATAPRQPAAKPLAERRSLNAAP
jgi:hypothetical protein